MAREPHVPPEPAARIVLGVCGGIAAYKAVEVCRRLVDAGAHVVPVLTDEATRFVGAVTFSALASEPVQTSLWDEASPIPHTRLGQSADLIVVAPATAHFMARYAAGLADDLLTATLLATRAPVLLCPAMHTEMWEHPSVQENLATLERRGWRSCRPETGRLAGGDSGEGRLADPGRHRRPGAGHGGAVGDADRPATWPGRRVVVSAGGTREALDPVRFLTNRSSGKQGHALAEAAARRGARVTLVTSSGSALADDVAAVGDPDRRGDRRPTWRRPWRWRVPDGRRRRHGGGRGRLPAQGGRPIASSPRTTACPNWCWSRRPTSWSAWCRVDRPGQVVVGFAAETNDVLERGRKKLPRKGVDLLVVNDVSAPGAGFDHDTNAVHHSRGGRQRHRDRP